MLILNKLLEAMSNTQEAELELAEAQKAYEEIGAAVQREVSPGSYLERLDGVYYIVRITEDGLSVEKPIITEPFESLEEDEFEDEEDAEEETETD